MPLIGQAFLDTVFQLSLFWNQWVELEFQEKSNASISGNKFKGMVLAQMPGRIFALKTYYLTILKTR
jgi:hypothetical protein